MRKPVGIFATKTTYPEYAVICDDSSIWIWNCNIRVWERLPDIPQDEPKPATSPGAVEALRELAKAEEEYREEHEQYGDGYSTARRWDKMRRAGDAAREVLKRIDGQEEQR